MASNSAAWLLSSQENPKPFTLDTSPMPIPGEGHIVIRNHAVAINPVDSVLQTFAVFPLKYPTMLGQDVSGVVTAIGSNVTRFKVGDRVLGHAAGLTTGVIAENAFQHFTLLNTNLVSEIPDEISFERAAVIPLGCSTGACAMFQKDLLSLQFPTEPRRNAVGKVILIWGGSSSVGCNSIQLAIAAGYEVITTASPRNFELVMKLGASQVFDYNKPSIVEDLVDALKEKTLAGTLDCISGPAWVPCFEVVHRASGSKMVITTRNDWTDPPNGVQVKGCFALTIKDNGVGKAIYEHFLPNALRSGAFVPAPEPLIVGKGLECIQDAVDRQMKGVSAEKVVVLL